MRGKSHSPDNNHCFYQCLNWRSPVFYESLLGSSPQCSHHALTQASPSTTTITKFWKALLWGHSPMFSKPFGNPAASLGVPLTWKHEKNHINPKTKILKPIFIAGQKDTCENFQFSTDQGDSYSGIFPIALLYLFDNLRMLLNWLLPDLTIPKALTLTCFGNMVGV